MGGLSGVLMTPESLKAGATGNFRVSFQLLNRLPADGVIVIELADQWQHDTSMSVQHGDALGASTCGQ